MPLILMPHVMYGRGASRSRADSQKELIENKSLDSRAVAYANVVVVVVTVDSLPESLVLTTTRTLPSCSLLLEHSRVLI